MNQSDFDKFVHLSNVLLCFVSCWGRDLQVQAQRTYLVSLVEVGRSAKEMLLQLLEEDFG